MIKRFKKKPVVIEAIQYTGKNDFEISSWTEKKAFSSPVVEPLP